MAKWEKMEKICCHHSAIELLFVQKVDTLLPFSIRFGIFKALKEALAKIITKYRVIYNGAIVFGCLYWRYCCSFICKDLLENNCRLCLICLQLFALILDVNNKLARIHADYVTRCISFYVGRMSCFYFPFKENLHFFLLLIFQCGFVEFWRHLHNSLLLDLCKKKKQQHRIKNRLNQKEKKMERI